MHHVQLFPVNGQRCGALAPLINNDSRPPAAVVHTVPDMIGVLSCVQHMQSVIIMDQRGGSAASLIVNLKIRTPATTIILRMPDVIRAVAKMHHMQSEARGGHGRGAFALLIRNPYVGHPTNSVKGRMPEIVGAGANMYHM